MQAPGSPIYPPPPPVGPNVRLSPGAPLYTAGASSGNLAPPAPSGAHLAGSPGYPNPGNALSPYRPPSAIVPPAPSLTPGVPRPYSAGPSRPPSAIPPPAGTPGYQNQPLPASSIYPQTPFTPNPGRPRPKKRLVVCCDGTWLDSDNGISSKGETALPSNVTRIGRAVKAESTDGVSQVVYYQGGVGTEGGPVSRLVGGATAEGLSENIREAYSFICHNWAPGDEIFLIGFSRGAFTARSIAGLISAVGLLTKEGIKDLGVVFRDVEHQRDPNYLSPFRDVPFADKPSASDPKYAAELARRNLSRTNVPIKAVAVWDTVGSLGIPRVAWLERLGLQSRNLKEYAFYDTALTPNIENAFQALALDEQRASFAPTVWEKSKGAANMTNLRQVWFPGVHSNVGGGYDDQDLANITLAWMMAQLEPFLEFSPSYLREQYALNLRHYADSEQEPRPWSFGRIYRSLAGLYTLAGRSVRTPGNYFRCDPFSGAATRSRLRDTHEYVHPSVRSRLELGGPGVEDRGEYACPALDGYRLRVTGAPPGSAEPMAVWESRGRSRKGGGPKRVLMESPLFETEIRLLSGTPWVQNYLLNRDGGKTAGPGGGGRRAGRPPEPGPPTSGQGPVPGPIPGMGSGLLGSSPGPPDGRRPSRRRRDGDRDRRDRHRDRDRDRDGDHDKDLDR